MCHLWGRPNVRGMCHLQRVASSAAVMVVVVMQPIEVTESVKEVFQSKCD